MTHDGRAPTVHRLLSLDCYTFEAEGSPEHLINLIQVPGVSSAVLERSHPLVHSCETVPTWNMYLWADEVDPEALACALQSGCFKLTSKESSAQRRARFNSACENTKLGAQGGKDVVAPVNACTDRQSWSALCVEFANQGNLQEMASSILKMAAAGFNGPTEPAFSEMVIGLAENGLPSDAEALMCEAIGSGVTLTDAAYDAIVEGYCESDLAAGIASRTKKNTRAKMRQLRQRIDAVVGVTSPLPEPHPVSVKASTVSWACIAK
jgi:hypothetical protein